MINQETNSAPAAIPARSASTTLSAQQSTLNLPVAAPPPLDNNHPTTQIGGCIQDAGTPTPVPCCPFSRRGEGKDEGELPFSVAAPALGSGHSAPGSSEGELPSSVSPTLNSLPSSLSSGRSPGPRSCGTPICDQQSTINTQLLPNTQLSTLNFPAAAPLPWDQQPGETDKNFLAFRAYLSLGPGRSLGKTAEATGRTRDQLAHWSTRWRWRARAAAYHAHLAAIERKATEELVAAKGQDWVAMHETVRRQAWAEAEDLIALAQDFKSRWRDAERLPDFSALIRALELAFKLKQFAAGMPSEIKAVNTTVTGPGGSPIRVELEAALNKIYGQPTSGEVVDVATVEPQVGTLSTPSPSSCEAAQ